MHNELNAINRWVQTWKKETESVVLEVNMPFDSDVSKRICATPSASVHINDWQKFTPRSKEYEKLDRMVRLADRCTYDDPRYAESWRPCECCSLACTSVDRLESLQE